MPTHFPHAVGEMGQKASDPGGWLLLQKRVLNPEDIRMLNVFSPRNAVTTREPRLRVSPRDSSRSEQRCSRDTRSPPAGLRHRRAPTRAAPPTGVLQRRKRSAFGGARAGASRTLKCRVFNILPVSGAPTESHNLHLPRRLPRAQVAGKAAKSTPRREIFGRWRGVGVAFRERHAPGGRGAAVSVQRAQNWASWWPPRAKPCHGQDDAHVSCQVHPCPAAADGCFTSPEGPPPRPQLSLSILARLGVPWEKLWRQQE